MLALVQFGYSSPHLKRAPLLPNNSVIREVSFDERGNHLYSRHLLQRNCVLHVSRGVSSRECPLREGLL